jgi:hypothetical protein
MITKIFYSFLIAYFILFAVFWSNCRNRVILSLLKYLKKPILYLGFWHRWSVFSRPWTANMNLILNIEYDDEKKQSINLFESENMIFFNRKSNTFDEKFTENLLKIKPRTNFVYYLKKHIEKNNNKKIKKIEFVKENKEIKLWDSNPGVSNFIVLSSHEF